MRQPKSGYGNRRGRPARRVAAVAGVPREEELLADRVRVCYTDERTRFEQRKTGEEVTYVPPRAFAGRPATRMDDDDGPIVDRALESVWLKLARWCKSNDIHPESYIQVMFGDFMKPDRRAREPGQLMSPECLACWRKAEPTLLRRAALALHSQRRIAGNSIGADVAVGDREEDAMVRALSSEHLNLSPLFRYCVARQIDAPRFRAVADRYEAAAIVQFERFRWQYLQAWKEILPAGFAEYSAKRHPAVLASIQ